MTARQNAFYWQLWQKACAVNGWDRSDEEMRHSIHVSALDYDKSHLDFDNREFDRIINALKLCINPDDLTAVMFFGDELQGEKKRLLWRIRHTAPEPYIKAISSDVFGTIYFEDLDVSQLEKLRNTLANRARAWKRCNELDPVQR